MRGLTLIIGLFATPVLAHDVITTKLTWTKEISRLVYKRCGSCHHQNGAAMSLMTYEAARPWAKAIRDEVLSRRMPPWGAVKGIGDFLGDPSLSQPEIELLVGWVEGGAPEGEAEYLPSRMPEFRTEAVRLPRYSRAVPVASELRLSRAATLVAIRPVKLAERSSLEAWAVLPGGGVRRLVWLTDFRQRRSRDYVFREPVKLPQGTRLRVSGEESSVLFFLAD